MRVPATSRGIETRDGALAQPHRRAGSLQRGIAGISGGGRVSMRIPINLASEPFRRDRPVLIASAACGVVLVALLGVLVFLILSERSRQTDTRAAVAKLNAEVLTLSNQQAQMEATLRLPMNAEVL